MRKSTTNADCPYFCFMQRGLHHGFNKSRAAHCKIKIVIIKLDIYHNNCLLL